MKAHVLQPPKNTLKLQYATCGYIHKYKIRIKHTPAYLFVFICVYTCESKVDYYNFTNDYVLKDMKLNRNIFNNTKG